MPSTLSIWMETSDKDKLKWDLYLVENRYQNQFLIWKEYHENHYEIPQETHSLRGQPQWEEFQSLDIGLLQYCIGNL